jgi:hypothetical protein
LFCLFRCIIQYVFSSFVHNSVLIKYIPLNTIFIPWIFYCLCYVVNVASYMIVVSIAYNSEVCHLYL